MAEVFVLALGQMGKMFVFMFLGYILRKGGIVSDKFGRDLSMLMLWVISPAFNIRNLSRNVSVDTLADNGVVIVCSVLFLAVSLVISHFLAKILSKNKLSRAVYEYSFVLPNFAYVGYPIVQAVFGEQMLANMLIFCIPYTVMVYTWGICLLDSASGFKITKILKPPTIALFIGFAIGLFNIELPAVADGIISSAADCLTPIAMMLTGVAFARQPLLKMFKQPMVYLASFIRLMIIPAIIGGAAYLIGLPANIVIVGTVAVSMPMALNTVIFSEAGNGDSVLAAQLCVVSNFMGLVTIPIVCAVLGLI